MRIRSVRLVLSLVGLLVLGGRRGSGRRLDERCRHLGVPLPRARRRKRRVRRARQRRRELGSRSVGGGSRVAHPRPAWRRTARRSLPAWTLAPGQHYLFTNNAAGGYSGRGSWRHDLRHRISPTGPGGVASHWPTRRPSIDGVGGDGIGGTQCREGTGISGMPTTNGDNSYERVGGTLDTENNATDFLGPKPGNPQKSEATRQRPSPECVQHSRPRTARRTWR